MPMYKVSANISGKKRSVTDKSYRKKSTAQKYADETNKYRKGARARVIKAPKMKPVKKSKKHGYLTTKKGKIKGAYALARVSDGGTGRIHNRPRVRSLLKRKKK